VGKPGYPGGLITRRAVSTFCKIAGGRKFKSTPRYYFTTQTEDEILAQCAALATKDHNMKPEEITEELKDKIKSNIHKT